MFWAQTEILQSPIPELLEKEDLTLEELLDEDGLIQDTKWRDPKLIEYLSRPEQISSLLSYIVEPFLQGKHMVSKLVAKLRRKSRQSRYLTA